VKVAATAANASPGATLPRSLKRLYRSNPHLAPLLWPIATARRSKCDLITPAIGPTDPPLPSSIQQFSTVEAQCIEAFRVLRIGEPAASARMHRGCFLFIAPHNQTANHGSTPHPNTPTTLQI